MQLALKDKAGTAVVSGMKIEVVDITPGMAESWLTKNEGNRDVRSLRIKGYARDMQAGKWQLTGDPIRFSASGRLIDGQHRLKACVAADVGFTSLVIYNLPDEAQDVIDTNAPRSPADVLKLNGHAYWARMAPAARLLREIENGVATPMASGKDLTTNTEVLDVVQRHPRLITSVGIVVNAKPKGCHMTSLCVLHYIALHFSEHPDDAGAFLNVFKTGVPRYTGDAAHATRERLLRAQSDTARLPGHIQCMLMIQAWNNFKDRRQVSQVKNPTTVMIHGLDRNKLRKGTA